MTPSHKLAEGQATGRDAALFSDLRNDDLIACSVCEALLPAVRAVWK